eukprot:SAG31_NODE_1254_length_9087_cov_12.553071_11_plen_197_part_00
MLTSQIARTDRWLDDCCRPIDASLLQLQWTRSFFVAEAVHILEQSHPDVVTAMVATAETVGARVWQETGDGRVLSRRFGMAIFETETWGLTVAFENLYKICPTKASSMVMVTDLLLSNMSPFCHEMPRAVLDLVHAEPTCAVADLCESPFKATKTAVVLGLRWYTSLMVQIGNMFAPSSFQMRIESRLSCRGTRQQ